MIMNIVYMVQYLPPPHTISVPSVIFQQINRNKLKQFQRKLGATRWIFFCHDNDFDINYNILRWQKNLSLDVDAIHNCFRISTLHMCTIEY